MQLNTLQMKEKGQSLIELAMVLVFILILLVGIVDLGRVLFYYQAMRDASQEAVAYASAFPLDATYHPNCAAIIDRVIDNVADIDKSNVIVTYSDINNNSYPCAPKNGDVFKIACSGNTLTVTVNKTGFPLIMPLIGELIGRGINLSATTTATIIQPMCH